MLRVSEETYDLGFKKKVLLFSRDYLKCCIYIIQAGSFEEDQGFTKKLFSKLIGTSHVLEDFLDFHGAKDNKDWYFYRELSAAVHHLSLGAYCQKHILNRLIFYVLGDTGNFAEEGEKTLNFLTDCLKKLAPVIVNEARNLDIAIPEDRFTLYDFPGIMTPIRLENNISGKERVRQKKYIVKIASEFLNIAAHFDKFEFYNPYTLDEIREIVPTTINEVEIRRYEMLVHNLQSSFDTYVINGGYEFQGEHLRELRSHFSIVFHLLQMMGRLLHFYERHLHEAGFKDIYKKVRDRLAFMVDPDTLLDRTINYGLFFVCHYISNGKNIARKILNENIERGRIEVNVPVPRGFHSRPSLLVAKIVQHYGGQVELCAGDSRFDAGSVLDIQWAGGKIQNENIKKVVFEGDVRSLKDLEILASVNYGEDLMGNGIALPKELAYLKTRES